MPTSKLPPSSEQYSYSLLTLLAILVSTSSLTIGISIPVLPQIAESLHSELSTATLVVTSYFAGYALGQIPAGFLADRWGRLPVIYLGCSLFILSGLIGAFSDNLNVLLIMRFFQGLGGAVGPVVSRTIVRDISEGKTTLRLMANSVLYWLSLLLSRRLLAVLLPVFGAGVRLCLFCQWLSHSL